MPLVVPGINDNDHRKDSDKSWQDRLIGKKLGDVTDTTTFARKDLPATHRVIEDNGFATMDHNPNRVNVHLNKEGIISKVSKG